MKNTMRAHPFQNLDLAEISSQLDEILKVLKKISEK